MDLKIIPDSAPGFGCLQNLQANALGFIPATLFLFTLLAGSNVNQANAEPDNSAIGRSSPAYVIQNVAQYVNPLCGTAADGDLFPGATAPFGMIQWSPDTGSGQHCGGYAYEDSRISGFSLDHLSGAGCTYGENFAFMPIIGALTAAPDTPHMAFLTPFSHSVETAKPGYYAVTLGNGIKVELTATERSGFGRFTYPAKGPATMVINAASAVNGIKQSAIQIHPAQREITGWAVSGHFCGGPDESTVYFCAIFNRPFAGYGTWSDATLDKNGTNGEGRVSGAYVNFNTSENQIVLVKTAISYVSIANARDNLESESPLSAFSSEDFDNAVAAASHTWNSYLNQIQVSGGTRAELQTFYSMLYRVMLGPTICSDVNGEYMGYDGLVHRTEDHRVQYANFSGWDIYRSEAQLLAILVPNRASDMAQSLLVDYQQGGAFPRWGVPNEDSGVMMGDPAAPIIADFYAFRATNFDTHTALAGLVRAATDPSVRAPRTGTYERDALADYLKLGYVPEHQQGGYGNVSMTLEYDSADFALSQFAKALADDTDSVMLLQHAQNWKNLYNLDSGYMQMRRRDGSWAPGFKDDVGQYDGDQAYVEGTAAQYVWMVPFNLKGLAEKMGGPEAAAKRLDTFFTQLNASTESPYAYLGNEPCLETPWEYCFWGQPYKTQKVAREAMTQLFSSAPYGYPGNDDLGEMSSWYVFAAIGMYPELPGSDVLVLGSPLFPKAVLHLRNGDITILGHSAAPNAPYVQSLTVNSQTWDKPWIRFSDIAHGGNLTFSLGATSNTNWGSNLLDAPPSFTSESNSQH
ncbi:MAG TPA: GH92 family glycosyl hydrolase [Candidatus Saccharimonadales bacterium]|nr:GH92 family glycosyl hydrolase [Candidatus Saccharimonadales bacterium]